jgi:hypothetical protein
VQKTRKRFGPLKWLLSCIVAAFFGALAWITFEDITTLNDPRSAASHAAAIVLCSVHPEKPNPHFVVEEIWKHLRAMTRSPWVPFLFFRSHGMPQFRRLEGLLCFSAVRYGRGTEACRKTPFGSLTVM